MMKRDEKLEFAMGYILVAGVLLSLIVESVGLSLLYLQTGNLSLDFAPVWRLGGSDFFTYTVNVLSSIRLNSAPPTIMASGIILLMLTPYTRVVVSVAYFAGIRNYKYLMITTLVLVILTLSLLGY